MATVAEQLSAARSSMGLTVHQVAESTKIKTEHIRALEAGDYRAFAAPVYIRGFARAYARLLRLDPDELVENLDAELRQSGLFDDATLDAPRRHGLVDAIMLQFSKVNWRIVLPLVGVVLLVVIGTLSYRFYLEYRSRDPLSNLGSGQYQPEKPGAEELLPLPPSGDSAP